MIRDIPSLDIFSGKTSKRLFFAKASLSDNVWHILDFGASMHHPDGIQSMALHGHFVYPAISADTIEELNEKARSDADSICSGCLDAFDMAKEVIRDRELLAFGKKKKEMPIIIMP